MVVRSPRLVLLVVSLASCTLDAVGLGDVEPSGAGAAGGARASSGSESAAGGSSTADGGLGAGELGAGGSGPSTGAGAQGGGGAGGGATTRRCPDGEFLTGIEPDGTIACSSPAALAIASIDTHCSAYFGWRDLCDGCDQRPERYGRFNQSGHEESTSRLDFASHPLDADNPKLFSLDPDFGTIDLNDRFYAGLGCDSPAPGAEGCGPGRYGVELIDGVLQCSPVEPIAIRYFQRHCALALAWREDCTPNGCVDPPTSWVATTAESCVSSTEGKNVCRNDDLFGKAINLGALDLASPASSDGLYAGLRCDEPEASVGVGMRCPDGMLARGVHSNGNLLCESPLPILGASANERCRLYLGWRDSCDDCDLAPERWGRSTGQQCTIGAASSCVTAELDNRLFQLVGLPLGGTPNDDDKFFMGFGCF